MEQDSPSGRRVSCCCVPILNRSQLETSQIPRGSRHHVISPLSARILRKLRKKQTHEVELRSCPCNVRIMDDKNESGASYLASLRQPVGSAPAPAQAKEIASSDDDHAVSMPRQATATASEKRKSPRYRCSGSARLQEIGGPSATWATFTDISMHGCYVETSAPFSAGTLLDLKLDAGGVHVEARGEVRVAYPGVGMGISFITMSDSDRDRVRQLLASISPRSAILGPKATSNISDQPMPTAHSDVPLTTNAAETLRALSKFFESRHTMGRDEFLRISRSTR